MATRYFLRAPLAAPAQRSLALSVDGSIPSYNRYDSAHGYATREEAERAAAASTAVYAEWYPGAEPELALKVDVVAAELDESLGETEPLTFPAA